MVFRLEAVHEKVCGVALRPPIVRLKYEVSQNRKCDKDITIEHRKSIIKKTNDSLQGIPMGDKYVQKLT